MERHKLRAARRVGAYIVVCLQRVGLKKELPLVDHASCKFPPIKKNLYVQVSISQLQRVSGSAAVGSLCQFYGTQGQLALYTFAVVAVDNSLFILLRAF